MKSYVFHVRSYRDALAAARRLNGHIPKSIEVEAVEEHCGNTFSRLEGALCRVKALLRGLRQVLHAYNAYESITVFVYRPWKVTLSTDDGYTFIDFGAMQRIYAKLEVEVHEDLKWISVVLRARCTAYEG